MIAIIATMRVKPDHKTQFESTFNRFAAKVRNEEPGVLTYQLSRSRRETNTYRLLEIYASQAAVDAHSVYLKKNLANNPMTAMFDGPPDIEHLDCVL